MPRKYTPRAHIAALVVALLALVCATAAPRLDSRFGRKMLPLFMLDPRYTNVNHGSYGSIPHSVQAARNAYLEQCEWNPDKWFRETAETLLAEVRKDVAAYVNATSADNIVFVENASDGFNAVAKSFVWHEGDKILRSNTSYEMVKKTIDYLHNRYGVEAVPVGLDTETIQSWDLTIAAYKRAFEAQARGSIKLVVIDHIASTPGIIFPIKDLIAYFKAQGVPVVIDGAHAVGALALDVPSYGADFYFSNLHKWAYAPKSASFLWVRPEYVPQVLPNIIGNFYGQGFQREFFWTGTRDFTSYLAVRDALRFREALGDDAIRQYQHDLCTLVAETVSAIWNTTVLAFKAEMYATMINIRLPTDDLLLAQKIQQDMFDIDDTYMVVYQFDGHVYTRLSCQIYNGIEDYEFVANTFLDRLNKA